MTNFNFLVIDYKTSSLQPILRHTQGREKGLYSKAAVQMADDPPFRVCFIGSHIQCSQSLNLTGQNMICGSAELCYFLLAFILCVRARMEASYCDELDKHMERVSSQLL